MENKDLLVPNNIIFCEKRWQIGAALLGVLTFVTFAWGFVILGNYLEEYDFEDYSIKSMDGGMASLINTASGVPQLQEIAAPVVVTIVTVGQQGQSIAVGSGAIIHPDGYVLTNLHAIHGQPHVAIQIQTPNDIRQYKVEIIKTHQQHDLALLKIVTNDRFLFLKLADTQKSQNGTQVMTLGKDARGATLATTGAIRQQDMVVRIDDKTSMTHLLKSDAPVTWQQGGGPMINNNAELVGINLIINSNNGAENYAIPAHVIKAHFQDVVRFTSTASQQNGNVTQNPAKKASVGLGKLASSWWGRARDLQLQEQQKATVAANPSHTASTNHFGTMGVNIMGTNVAATAPVATTAQPGSPAQATAPTLAMAPAITTPPPTPVADNPQVAHIGSAGDMVTLIDLEQETGFNIGGYELDAMIGLAILGLISGIIGALMPMGGSIVVVTGMMMFFTYGLYLIRPVIYVTNLFTYGIPAYRYMHKGLIMRDRLRPLFTWVAIGVLLGYFIGHNMQDHLIGYFLGLFALVMAGIALYDLRVADDDTQTVTVVKPKSNTEEINAFLDNVTVEKEDDQKDNMLQTAIMGAPLGLLTGMLGVSGGLLEIFYQRRVAGISSSNALANASVMVFVASLTAAIVSFLYGTSIGAFAWQTPLTLAMILVPSAFAGGIIGHRLCERLTKQQQRYGFAACMLIVSLTMLFAQ